MGFFNPDNFSDRYRDEIAALTAWYAERLPALGPVTLTRAQFNAGTDSLTGAHAELKREAFDTWLGERRYELSYNQDCIAFFSAAQQVGVLEVLGSAS